MLVAWVAATDAYNSAMLARESARAAAEVRAITQAQDVAMGIATMTDPKLRLHPGDCSSCGSQEFRHWHGRSVCAYCRSVAAPAARTGPAYDPVAARHRAMKVAYGESLSITRPHTHYRITTD